MPRFFNLGVDLTSLTDECFAFVVDPTPARNEREVIQELHDFAPDMVPVLESMVLDGVEDRTDVAEYVGWMMGGDARSSSIRLLDSGS